MPCWVNIGPLRTVLHRTLIHGLHNLCPLFDPFCGERPQGSQVFPHALQLLLDAVGDLAVEFPCRVAQQHLQVADKLVHKPLPVDLFPETEQSMSTKTAASSGRRQTCTQTSSRGPVPRNRTKYESKDSSIFRSQTNLFQWT